MDSEYHPFYWLDENHHPYPVDETNPAELAKFAEWFEQPGKRQVARTDIGEIAVSTVFLGIRIPFSEGKMFETMVFYPNDTSDTHRTFTWEEALAMHDKTVAEVLRAGAGDSRDG